MPQSLQLHLPFHIRVSHPQSRFSRRDQLTVAAWGGRGVPSLPTPTVLPPSAPPATVSIEYLVHKLAEETAHVAALRPKMELDDVLGTTRSVAEPAVCLND